jgi:predicted dehydrogenase
MADRVKWGVLGVAKIAVEKVIPAMQRGEWSEVCAIASRSLERAQSAADALGLEKAYGSYQELISDPEIEAIYNPLPNHLHVPWTTLAAESGKHVLCEKPIALSAQEAAQLLDVRDRTGMKIEEAFMVRTHPQWVETRSLIRSGSIGELRAIQGTFSYFNRDPQNVRNVPEWGGGGLMDIGCYPITTSRFVLDREPSRVTGLIEYDPDFQVDRLTSAILDFGNVQSSFLCSTQMVPYQRMHFFGTEGRIEVEIPFNAPPDRPCRIFVDGGDLFGKELVKQEFPVCDQYTIQGDLFSKAIRSDIEPAVSLENSVCNMQVIDAIVRSAKSGSWEELNW